jgi:hypothetical protein
MRHLILLTAFAAFASVVSCNVNQFCLNCEKGDGGILDGPSDATTNDGGDGGTCVPTNGGVEKCDGIDNDCNGMIDDGPIAGVGEPCDNVVGECAGGVKVCSAVAGVTTLHCTKNPVPEICDGKDNDCNGLTDEGDPGGGAKCGTDVGECIAGVNHCITGTVQCIGAIGTVGGQPEICDGKDNDCDGLFDEGLTNLGTCGGGPPGNENTGLCHTGTLSCMGGGTLCSGDQEPTFELCDGLDNDCDGLIDEDYHLDTDPQNCGTCNHVCSLAHAFAGCAAGGCTVASCQGGFHDNDHQAADGCEYGPCFVQGAEICNGVDDDCNGVIDDNVTPPSNLCLTAGACAGSFAMCDGVGGFKCVYPSGQVSLDANGNIIPETTCDGIDNDCDGKIDEGQPNLNATCHDNGVGVCQGTGTFQCDPANLDGPAKCVITTAGASPGPETCDNLDNDCDGVVDNIGEPNGASTGNLDVGNPAGGQDWVTIPGSGTQIMKWEASKADATAAVVGSAQKIVCSKQGVQPWTNVTYPQALAACTAIGARLCTEPEWQSMCSQPGTVTYPVAGPTGTTDYVFIEAENAQANVAGTAGGTSRTWATDTTTNFSGTKDLIATPNTGATVSAGNAPLQSPRLDFQINFQSTGSYFVWVRLFGASGSDNSVFVGINATVPGTANGTTVGNDNDQLGLWQWVVSPAINVAATGNKFVSVYMREDGTRVDAIAISKDGVDLPPFDNQIWAYQNNPKLAQPQVCNDQEFDTGAAAGNQDDILPTGSMPACFANGAGGNDAFDMSGNVAEWCNARSAGQNPIRGGTSDTDVTGTSCTLNFTLADNTFFFPNVGFRCCR